ncbi:MAG: SGNH/GDSL hydrolase family protein [Myxococcaceae bacterium]|nr:SGNH/GDSL hydrolase family protein [Myxococcaceae bacterium]
MKRALLGLIICACGTPLPEGPDASVEDAGESLDASVPADAGEVPDAGVIFDAGVTVDAGEVTVDAGVPDAGPLGTLLYPAGALHSPLTPDVVTNLRTIAARAPRTATRLSKVGDSNTVNPSYLECFEGANVDLDGRTALQATVNHFRGSMSYGRTSLAATVGWSAGSAIAGTPSPLENEVNAHDPRYATVMFGTNDVGGMNLDTFGRNLFGIADRLTMAGVVPVLSAIPARDDSAAVDAWVPRYNAVIRGVAQARGLPFVDLHRALSPLASHGLGADGVHLDVYFPGARRPCVFTPAGLAFGHNVRNLVTLEALDRTVKAVRDGVASDATGVRLAGQGSAAAPFEVPALPFGDLRDTRVAGEKRLAAYGGCSSAADESGPEVYYALTLPAAATLRFDVISLGGADIDVHLLDATKTAAGCLQRNDKSITAALAAGTYYLALDTYVSGGVERAGEYLLLVTKP